MIDRLVFAGEALVDLVLTIPALPERGGDVLAPRAAATPRYVCEGLWVTGIQTCTVVPAPGVDSRRA